MVGSETSGNRTPSNNIQIRATAQLLDFLRSLPNPKGIPHFNLITRDFLEAHKEEFISRFGEEVYKEHIERYSRNASEMQRDRLEKEKEALKKQEELLALKKKDQQLKERELDLRENHSNNKELEELQDALEGINNSIENLKNTDEYFCQKHYGMSKSEREQELLSKKESVTKQISELLGN